MKKITFLSIALTSALIVSGCSSKPTRADIMRSHAAETKADLELQKKLAADWDRGAKLVSRGEKNISDGEKRLRAAERDLDRARKQIAQGQKEVADGQKLVLESEQGFKTSFPELPVQSRK